MNHSIFRQRENIIIQLITKGIYEAGDYSIQPLKLGDYNLFTIKCRNSAISSKIFNNLNNAIETFSKLNLTITSN